MSTILHNLKFAYRNIFKSRIYSLFNILGFAMGFTICIITGLYIYREFNVDKSFKEYRNIYRLVDLETNISEIDYDLAEKMRSRFPEIKHITPVLYSYEWEFLLKKQEGENYISVQNIINTENDFFNIFRMNFIAGNPTQAFNGYSVVITKSVAAKLFGRTNVVGEKITLLRAGDPLPVSAVIEDMPENASLKGEIFINSETGTRYSQICRNGNDICYNPYPIYVTVNEGTNIRLLEDKINAHFPENLSETEKIRLQPLTDIYFDKTVTDSQNLPGNRALVYIFITIAGIVLALSVINYVNFALSQQLDTLKQLGVKITYGASMRQLRTYYVAEIGLSVLFAFLLSLLIATYTLPLFEQVLGVQLSMLTLFKPVFLLGIPVILSLVILITALTPFYIISKFDIQMLFGKKKTYFGKQRGKMLLTGCQMGITVVMFICLFTLHKQVGYMKSYDLGFDKDHLIRIEVPGPANYEAFKNEIAQYDFVKNVVATGEAPGFLGSWESMTNEENKQSISISKIHTEPGFLQTFNLQLLEGRDFTEADRSTACIVNEETMHQMGWQNIEGKKFNGRPVIGLVKDFNVSSLHNRMQPISIVPLKKEEIMGAPLSVNIKGDIHNSLAQLRQSWKKIYPDEPFNYRFYNEVFDAYYKKEERQSAAIAIISVIAIVITCMGLIGQVKQTTLAKAKEIGIRKINGATIVQIMLVIPKNFLICFAVAFIFAIPIAWIAMNKWLENFAFKTSLNGWIFLLSGILVFLLLTLFVSWQTWKAATANPVDIIKSE